MFKDSDVPSLKALVAFESTVRLGSMTAAARELGISQPLVSQRIRALEEMLGLVMIDRTLKPVQPTPVGRQFYGQIDASVSGIKTAVTHMKRINVSGRPKIKIAAPFGFMFFWIMPKLQELQVEFDQIQFEVQPASYSSSVKNTEADIVFYFGRLERLYNFEYQIKPERVRPICSPGFAQQYNLKAGSYLHSILDYPLLHMDTNNESWIDWNDWARILNIKPRVEAIEFYFNNYPLIIDAVKDGRGIALGWDGLIEPLISDGTIVPLEPEISFSHRGYNICSDYQDTHLVKSLIDWFISKV